MPARVSVQFMCCLCDCLHIPVCVCSPCTQNVMAAGHSLGGAMANLAAVDIANTMEWASVKVYTVGAPRAGNHAYAKMYNKLVPDTWSIINYRVRDAAVAAHVAVI